MEYWKTRPSYLLHPGYKTPLPHTVAVILKCSAGEDAVAVVGVHIWMALRCSDFEVLQIEAEFGVFKVLIFPQLVVTLYLQA